jgi:acetyl-CoA carboxylase carboxyltransferase component
VLNEGGRVSAAERSGVEVVHFPHVKQPPYSGIKVIIAMAGVRLFEIEFLSFVGPATLAIVVRKGYSATLVQLLTDRLKVISSLTRLLLTTETAVLEVDDVLVLVRRRLRRHCREIASVLVRKSTMRPRARLYYEQLEEEDKGKRCGMVSTQRKMSDEIVERSDQGDDVSKKADDMDADNKDENDETDKGATHVSTSCCR